MNLTCNNMIAPVLLSAAMLTAAGCAHNPNNPVVPSSAVQMSSGDKQIAFTAPHDGVVYVRDDEENRIVFSSDVKKSQSVRYDPKSQRVMIDDAPVSEPIPGDNHQHSIFFQHSGGPDAASASSDAGNKAGVNPTTAPANVPVVPVIRVPVGVQVDVQTQPAGGK